MRPRAPARAAVLLLLLAAGCAGPGADDAALASAAPVVPPAGWRTLSAFAFEQRALAWPAAGERGAPLDDAALEQLAAALGSGDALAVRAAVLLARSADPRAGRALLARLEQRVDTEPPAGERHADAADVVAAAALWDWTVAPDQAARLARLAVGPEAHPDVEVRVECAASALHQGRDEVLPFLFAVLRSITPDEARAGIDWPAKRTMTWAKSRAAEALSRRAGVPVTFRPDGSYAHQHAEAERLEALLSSALPE